MSVAELAAVLSAVHVLGIALSLGAVHARYRALTDGDVARTLNADNWWGIASILVIGSGLLRLFGRYEKGTDFYFAMDMFWVKACLIGAVLVLEIWPMVVFLRWRIVRAQGGLAETGRMSLFAKMSLLQFGILCVIPFAAALMARGQHLWR